MYNYVAAHIWTGLYQLHVQFLNIALCVCVCVCVCARVMSTPKAINSGMICTPYDWLNKLHNLYMQTLVSIVGMTLEMKCIIETSLIRVNYICII